MLVRRAHVELFYNGKNITIDISKDLESFSYTDNASGKLPSFCMHFYKK
jgi:hypothetical protein